MKIAICGDVSVTDYSRPIFEKQDEQAAFGDVLQVFAENDRVLVNLECALTNGEYRIKKYGPNLKGPLTTADTLKKAGVTDCMLSNNHVFDFGVEGLCDTVAALDRCGLKWTGIGDNYDASRKDHVIVQDGITVTVIDVCEHEYTYATENRMGARPFDPFETMDDIRRAKKSADYVIVVYHGGKEHCQYPSPRLLNACREMVRCGADVVLCQHSHCIGCYEKFENGHILYGQGNFHFVKYIDNAQWAEGLLVQLDITKEGIEPTFVPVKANDCGIELKHGKEKDDTLAAFWARSETIRNGSWKQHWHEFAESMREAYTKPLCGRSPESPAEVFQHFAHYLDCEAHTDMWHELFPTWNQTNELEKVQKLKP